ncbi:hypothetical protein N9I19_20160 [Peribacillus sp. CSMR9]|nr:hypothetical protein [Peribacillus sp. CSMR9]
MRGESGNFELSPLIKQENAIDLEGIPFIADYHFSFLLDNSSIDFAVVSKEGVLPCHLILFHVLFLLLEWPSLN